MYAAYDSRSRKFYARIFQWILAGEFFSGCSRAVARRGSAGCPPIGGEHGSCPLSDPPGVYDRPSILSYVNLFPSNPKWANMPIRVFNEAGGRSGLT